ncbi:hypothetical protein EVAR_89805_1 [Eumeta japonica]|uniref:Uncharacterized protein n=1 Tax=Eumeta variegata TaxID=151549 RepID=A0A4C1SK31_EUMVA|nr:hypothetical protein EVAR_89805_1 [Eumeta japonica]
MKKAPGIELLAYQHSPRLRSNRNPDRYQIHKWYRTQNWESTPGGIEIVNETKVEIECKTKIRIKSMTGIGIRNSIGIRIESGTRIEIGTRSGTDFDRDQMLFSWNGRGTDEDPWDLSSGFRYAAGVLDGSRGETLMFQLTATRPAQKPHHRDERKYKKTNIKFEPLTGELKSSQTLVQKRAAANRAGVQLFALTMAVLQLNIPAFQPARRQLHPHFSNVRPECTSCFSMSLNTKMNLAAVDFELPESKWSWPPMGIRNGIGIDRRVVV